MGVDATNSYYRDGSTAGVKLEFYHVGSGRKVTFKAFLTQMDDSFDTKFNKEEAYGRMDPFQIFQGTSRTISLSWQIPAHSAAEAKENLRRCSLIAAMQYPVYESAGRRASTIKGAPIIKIKFANLITSNTSIGGSAKQSGLAGAMGGLQFSPNVEAGFIIDNTRGEVMLYPKLVELSCNFAVIHEHSLGWDVKGNARGRAMKRFPYNISNTNVLTTTDKKTKEPDTVSEARVEEARKVIEAAAIAADVDARHAEFGNLTALSIEEGTLSQGQLQLRVNDPLLHLPSHVLDLAAGKRAYQPTADPSGGEAGSLRAGLNSEINEELLDFQLRDRRVLTRLGSIFRNFKKDLE